MSLLVKSPYYCIPPGRRLIFRLVRQLYVGQHRRPEVDVEDGGQEEQVEKQQGQQEAEGEGGGGGHLEATEIILQSTLDPHTLFVVQVHSIWIKL